MMPAREPCIPDPIFDEGDTEGAPPSSEFVIPPLVRPRSTGFGARPLQHTRERPTGLLGGGPTPWILWLVSCVLAVLLGLHRLAQPQELRTLDAGGEPERVEFLQRTIPAAEAPRIAAVPLPAPREVCSDPPPPARPRPRPAPLPAPPKPPLVAPQTTPQPATPVVLAPAPEADDLGLMPVPVRTSPTGTPS